MDTDQVMTPSLLEEDTPNGLHTNSFLASIPPEVLEAILLHLALRDLYACLQLNRDITRFIQCSPRIQYTIELHRTNQEEIAQSARSIPVSDKLRLLRSLRLGWMNGYASKREQLLFGTPLRHIELHASRLTYLARDLLVQGENGDWTVRIDLTLPEGQPPATTIKYKPSFTLPAVALASDSSQSVLVAIQPDDEQIANGPVQRLRIEPLSLTTGLRRPDSTSSPIFIFVPTTQPQKEFIIDIWKEWIIVVARWRSLSERVRPVSPSSRCFLRNWKTGAAIDCDGLDFLCARFLDGSTILATRRAPKSPGDILLCKFNSNTGGLAISHVFKTPRARGPVEGMTISTPQLSHVSSVVDERTESARYPLFRANSQGAVVAFSLGMRATWPGPLPYTLIVQAATFLDASGLFPESQSVTPGDPVQVAWEDWGPTRSRLINGGRLPSLHSTGSRPYGYRYPLPVGAADGMPSCLRILNFNTIPCTHQGMAVETYGGKHTCVRKPDTICDPSVWDEAVTTGLPYCYGEIEGEFDAAKDVVMDAEKLFVTKECGAGITKVEMIWM